MLTLSPLSEDVLDAVLELHNAAVIHDRVPEATFRAKTLDDPDFDADLAPVARDGGRVVGYMAGVCRASEGGLDAGILAFAVHGDYRGQGIASRMLIHVEERVRARGAKSTCVGFTRPNYLTAGIDPRYTPAVAFLLRRGYKKGGEIFNMDVDLLSSDWETSALEMDLAGRGIRCVRLSDESMGALQRFFAEEGTSPGWQFQIMQAARREPPGVFVALDDPGNVQGFAVYDGVRPGWFGPMATRETARGKGIGSLTYLKCLQAMKAEGYETAVINAVGPLPFYSRVSGAVVSRVFWRMVKDLGQPVS